MTWVSARLLRAISLLLYAGLFDYLLISGQHVRYVGSRTEWVVWFGAITLTVVALGYAWTLRGARPVKPPTARETLGTLGLLAPILLLFVIPSPQLGAQAALKKSGTLAKLPLDEASDGGPITIYDLAAASADPEYARRRGLREGQRVQIDGLVVTAGGAGVPVDLARFRASCCAADAIPFRVRVETPPESSRYGTDAWLLVTGTLVREEYGGWSVDAEQVEETASPDDPYAY